MKRRNLLMLATAMLFSTQLISAATLRGKVLDKSTGEPLLGATVVVKGTTTGTSTGFDGSFQINAKRDEQLVVSYISYLSQEITAERGLDDLTISLEPDTQVLASVQVVTKANLATEANLQNERIASHVAIENLGVKEMSLKGLSNVEDGVKKMTGISIADAGQVFVRGLGDRYSLTTLNGVPVASPNPDNKLIPLDIFPASAIQNVTVSKVYRVDAFADYAGALIDISTRDLVSKDFFSISGSIGANTNTTGKTFYQSDRDGTMFTTSQMPSGLSANPSSAQKKAYMTSEDRFDTSFSVDEKTSLPVFGVSAGYGKKWDINGNDLDFIASVDVSNDQQTVEDAYINTYDANGKVIDACDYDSYTTSLETSALASLGYDFGGNYLNYTMFYARKAEDNYKYRVFNDDDTSLIYGNNSTFHSYSLLNNQLRGEHDLNEQWSLDWTAVYSLTNSDEPDRRQSLFLPNADGTFSFYTKDSDNTKRYYATLDENQVVGDITATYKFGDESANKMSFGGAYRAKDRDYESIIYTYDTKGFEGSEITDIHSLDSYLNFDNIANGTINPGITIEPLGNYYATSNVMAGFAQIDYTIGRMLLNVGARVESSTQEVKYWMDGSTPENFQIAKLEGVDIFPALNLRYSLQDKSSLRLALSKSVTRPSFIEMAPFLYQESYGSAAVRGNENIENGYNYNIDLRYEYFAPKGTDMFSITGYYKYLQTPIERVQENEGGTTVYSFANSTGDGLAAGVEIEARKEILKNLRLGVNGSYIYTHVVLEEGGGIYTESERQLQGASPYLINADITYTLKLKELRDLNFALLYNLQGPRIDAVGVNSQNDIIQDKINTLDFVCSYKPNEKWSVKFEAGNLMNAEYRYTQEVKSTGENIEVSKYRTGIDLSIGATLNF